MIQGDRPLRKRSWASWIVWASITRSIVSMSRTYAPAQPALCSALQRILYLPFLARKNKSTLSQPSRPWRLCQRSQAQMGPSYGPLPIRPQPKELKFEQSSASRATSKTNLPRQTLIRSVLASWQITHHRTMISTCWMPGGTPQVRS